MHLEREKLGSHAQKGEDSLYHIDEVNKDTTMSFQHKYPNVNSCQKEKLREKERSKFQFMPKREAYAEKKVFTSIDLLGFLMQIIWRTM